MDDTRAEADDPSPSDRQRAPVLNKIAWGLGTASVGVLCAGALVWGTFGAGGRRVASRTIETRGGERAQVTLADGSRATLAPGSRLVDASNGRGPRLVELTGEAYFEVLHDPRRPFSVRASNAVTEDIGAHFVVRAYPNDREVRVTVTEGAITLRANAAFERHWVSSGMLGVVTPNGETAVAAASGAQADALLAWRSGQLVFDHAPLARVAEDLERWYDLDLRFDDPRLATDSISGSLSATAVGEALDTVASIAGVSWERHGRTVRFAPRHK